MTKPEIEPDGYETDRRGIDEPPAPYDPHYEIDGNAYAWGKTARLLTEAQLLQALSDTNGAFFAVDLCSSYPYYRQMMAGQHKQRSREVSKREMGAFVNRALYVNPAKNPLPSMRDFDPETTRKLRDMLGRKGKKARELLHWAVFDLIASPPKGAISDTDGQTDEEKKFRISFIRENLLEKFYNSENVELILMEPGGKMGEKGNWQYITAEKKGITLFNELASKIGEDQVHQFLHDAAGYFSEGLIDRLRHVIHVSLDLKDISILGDEAGRCFPGRFLATRFFASAMDTDRHIRADVSALPFGKETVSFFSCVEGWPFYFGDQDLEGKTKLASTIYSALKPGGRAVFVPWAVKREDFDTLGNIRYQEEQLERVEAFWRQNGLSVNKQSYTRDELMGDMSDRELVLVDHSPVFTKGDGIVTVLTLTKPKAA